MEWSVCLAPSALLPPGGALPHGRLVELLAGVLREGPAAAVAGQGEGGAGPAAEDFARQGVQRAGQAGLRAGRVGVRDHVGVPLVLRSGVVPGSGQGRLQGPQRGRAGRARRRQVAGIGGRLRLRRRAVREKVVVGAGPVIVALVIWREAEKEGGREAGGRQAGAPAAAERGPAPLSP